MRRDDQEKDIFSKIDFQSSGGLNEKGPQRVALFSDWWTVLERLGEVAFLEEVFTGPAL